MNFMNRKMFQVGGTVTYADGRTDNISIKDFTQQINALSDADLFALRNSADAGQIFISSELKSILDSVTDRKSIPITQNIGRPASISSLSDIGRIAKGLYLPAISGLTRQIFSEEQLANMPAVRSVAEYDSPFYGEGVEGFRETAERGGRSAEELAAILKPSVQDFEEEVAEITTPVVETEDTLDIDIPTSMTDVEPKTFTPDIDAMSEMSTTLGTRFEPGSVGFEREQGRRLAFEKAIEGRDEFGELIPTDRPPTPSMPPENLSGLDEIDVLVEDIMPTDALAQNKFGVDDIKPNLLKVDTSITDADLKSFNQAELPDAPKETTGIFGSDRFLDFIRNVGAGLVSTGQMGEGLAVGAAKAAEERTARDLLKEQEEREFQKAKRLLQIEAGLEGEETMESEDILKLSNDIETLYTDFEGGLAATGFTDYAIEIIEEAQASGKPVGGARGFFRKMLDKGFAFAGMGGDFDSLSADSKVEALTKVVKQKNLQAILGESGRTISDKDRVIIEKVFGTLDAFTNVDAVLGTLKESRRGLAQNNLSRKNKIIASADILKDQGKYGTRFYNSQLPSLKRLLGLDPLASQSAIARAQFGGTGVLGFENTSGIPTIDL